MKFDGSGSVEKHIREFRCKINTLRNLGDTLENEEYMQQLLKSLSKEFLPLKHVLGDDLDYITWDKLQYKIVNF